MLKGKEAQARQLNGKDIVDNISTLIGGEAEWKTLRWR
jgi:hypothetical protein